jgi:hypothetical protein
MQQHSSTATWNQSSLTHVLHVSLQSSRQEDAEALVRLLSPEGG